MRAPSGFLLDVSKHEFDSFRHDIFSDARNSKAYHVQQCIDDIPFYEKAMGNVSRRAEVRASGCVFLVLSSVAALIRTEEGKKTALWDRTSCRVSIRLRGGEHPSLGVGEWSDPNGGLLGVG